MDGNSNIQLIKKIIMKLYLNVAVAAILMTLTAKAQDVNIGIKGGLNIYNIQNNNGVKYDNQLGFNLGLIGHVHLTKQLALQPELIYSLQGAKYMNSGVETNIKLGYINVPILLQYMFDNGFRLQAGPQIGFLVNAKSKTPNSTVDIKDNFKKVDVGLGAGIGYVNPKSNFGVDARYNFGLSDINKNSTVKSNNRGFQLGVFYLFHHK